MPERKSAVGSLSAIVDNRTHELILTLKDEKGAPFELALHPGIIGALAVTLFRVGATAQASQHDAKGVTAQPMALTAAIPAVGPAGQPVLDLVLEGSMHFPVTFPKSAIPIIQNALATLARATNEPPSQSRN